MASAMRISVVAALTLAGCSAAPQAQAGSPAGCQQSWLPLAGRVTDADQLLKEAERVQLANRLAAIETRTGHQIVVATVPSLQGLPVETYSRCLANHWGIGRKDINDGVVLLLAKRDHAVRIEVGRGLEARLTNAEAKTILDNSIMPRLKADDIASGIAAGIDGIANEIS